jgi:GNAT superfamily N-acetyltransferase
MFRASWKGTPMDMKSLKSGLGGDAVDGAVVVSRVADGQWHALDEDVVVGRGYSERRPDGRLFVSVDAWREETFDLLAGVMVGGLPGPLYTVVDEADAGLTAGWVRAGFGVRRREWEYVVPTDPAVTGLGGAAVPEGVVVVPAGAADVGLLRAVDREIRVEVEASVGWSSMPAEVLARPVGETIVDPSKYAAAECGGRYVGLIRVVTVNRSRVGLVAVLAGERRRGIGRALLAHGLGELFRAGVGEAWADVQESNRAAMALFEGVGARSVSSNLELVR